MSDPRANDESRDGPMADATARSANGLLIAEGLAKSFFQGTVEVPVLTGVDLTVMPGDTVAIVGASGSGKSTLLHLLGGLDTPTAGRVVLEGADLAGLGEAQCGAVRNRSLGFVYQFHHLLPEFSALENVAMPLLIRRTARAEALALAEAVLRDVGLAHRLTHRPSALSGGERQRVAVARALVTRPKALLADEPTGNLDRASAEAVFALMKDLCQGKATALITVTHDVALASRMERVLTLREGRLY